MNDTNNSSKYKVTGSKPTVIFIVGGPGSGKGTQCKLLVDEFGFIHLSIGDILREVRLRDTDEAKKVNNYMLEYEKSGKLMPSEYIIDIMKMAMIEKGWEKNIYLIDGFIKTRKMYDIWEKELGELVDVKKVIFYDVPVSTLEERLLKRAKIENRGDDNIEIIRKRFALYEKETLPVIQYFKSIGLLATIHADDSIQEVFVESKDTVKLCLGWY